MVGSISMFPKRSKIPPPDSGMKRLRKDQRWRERSRWIDWGIDHPVQAAIAALIPPGLQGIAVEAIHSSNMLFAEKIALDILFSLVLLVPPIVFVVLNLPRSMRASLQVRALRFSEAAVLRLLFRHVRKVLAIACPLVQNSPVLIVDPHRFAATSPEDLAIIEHAIRSRTRYVGLLVDSVARYFGTNRGTIESLLDCAVERLEDRCLTVARLRWWLSGDPRDPAVLESEGKPIVECIARLDARLVQMDQAAEAVAATVLSVQGELSTGRAVEKSAEIVAEHIPVGSGGETASRTLGELMDLREGPQLTRLLLYRGDPLPDEAVAATLGSYLRALPNLLAAGREKTVEAALRAFDADELKAVFSQRSLFLVTGYSRIVAQVLGKIAGPRKDISVGIVVPEVSSPRLLERVRRESRAMRAELQKYSDLSTRVFSTTPPRMHRMNASLDGAMFVLGCGALTRSGQAIHQRARFDVIAELAREARSPLPVMGICEGFKIVDDVPKDEMLRRTLVSFFAEHLDVAVIGTRYYAKGSLLCSRDIAAQRTIWRQIVTDKLGSNVWPLLDSLAAMTVAPGDPPTLGLDRKSEEPPWRVSMPNGFDEFTSRLDGLTAQLNGLLAEVRAWRTDTPPTTGTD